MYIFLILIILIGLTILAFVLSPIPISLVIRKLFDGGMSVAPENYKEILDNVMIYRDISYNSKYDNGFMDIILKKESKEKLPVIFWVHGGGFVGGDKSDITEYGVQIAEKGYGVININYGLAPKSKYPIPLLQIIEAYKYIYINSHKYNLDMEKIYFAGDSAGAQIAGQFVNSQVDSEYGNLIGIEKVIDDRNIKGAILVCGPYDLDSFRKIENKAMKFAMKQIGWAYIGDKNWLKSEKTRELSLLDNISKNYPPAFITDGNFLSFEKQGRALAEKLKFYDIKVTDVFYLRSPELVHNYEFMMDYEESKHTFKRLIEFLNETKN